MKWRFVPLCVCLCEKECIPGGEVGGLSLRRHMMREVWSL